MEKYLVQVTFKTSYLQEVNNEEEAKQKTYEHFREVYGEKLMDKEMKVTKVQELNK